MLDFVQAVCILISKQSAEVMTTAAFVFYIHLLGYGRLDLLDSRSFPLYRILSYRFLLHFLMATV